MGQFFLYAYSFIGCIKCNTLHAQRLVFWAVLPSGDVETKSGPGTLDICAWNLNSILYNMILYESLS